MTPIEPLIPKHGGFRNLLSFRMAQLAYDVTARFCDRYINIKSRTHDQMVQAARSGVQNIAEGSVASGTSKKMELKLTNVARASLEELKLDYEDYLRQKNLALWDRNHSLRQDLVNRRPKTVDDVAIWIEEVHNSSEQNMMSYSEISANAAIVLITVACHLLDKQIAVLAGDFERQGGFTERLYRVRSSRRK